MSLAECVAGCQAHDHERGGHEHFLLATRDLNLTPSERDLMLSGWERAWVDRSHALDNLLAAIQAALDSLDASSDYQSPAGWKEGFLDSHGLKLDDRRVVIKED